jgi:molecular chaperone DnaJ
MADYYTILGIKRDATPDEVKSAYRTLALKCHPDTTKCESTAEFLKIKEACETLIEPARRKKYDENLNLQKNARARKPVPGVVNQPLEQLFSAFLRRWNFIDFDSWNRADFNSAETRESDELEIVLTPLEARQGCTLEVDLPTTQTCRVCDGSGKIQSAICPICHRSGRISRARTFQVIIPAGIKNGSQYLIPLDNDEIQPFQVQMTIWISPQ